MMKNPGHGGNASAKHLVHARRPSPLADAAGLRDPVHQRDGGQRLGFPGVIRVLDDDLVAEGASRGLGEFEVLGARSWHVFLLVHIVHSRFTARRIGSAPAPRRSVSGSSRDWGVRLVGGW